MTDTPTPPPAEAAQETREEAPERPDKTKPLYIRGGETRPDVLRLLDAAKRFIDHFFRNDGEKPRVYIPARPDHCDDLVLVGGIRQLANERDEARDLLAAERAARLAAEARASAAEAEARSYDERWEAMADQINTLTERALRAEGESARLREGGR